MEEKPARMPENEREPVICVKNLRKVYKMGEEKVVALSKINLSIYEGEICCIFGTSGSGKSTLLNLLYGMEKPTHGSVTILGKKVSAMTEQELAVFRQKNTGFVFQSYNLMEGMTALENVALPLMFCGVPRGKREKRAARMLERVGLAGRAAHFPSQMSGGQQQRVGIARALVTKPRLIFADEPTGNLDSKTTEDIMQMMMEFAREYHQTMIVVTHDPEMAKYATRIIHLVDGAIVDDRPGALSDAAEQTEALSAEPEAWPDETETTRAAEQNENPETPERPEQNEESQEY